MDEMISSPGGTSRKRPSPGTFLCNVAKKVSKLNTKADEAEISRMRRESPYHTNKFVNPPIVDRLRSPLHDYNPPEYTWTKRSLLEEQANAIPGYTHPTGDIIKSTGDVHERCGLTATQSFLDTPQVTDFDGLMNKLGANQTQERRSTHGDYSNRREQPIWNHRYQSPRTYKGRQSVTERDESKSTSEKNIQTNLTLPGNLGLQLGHDLYHTDISSYIDIPKTWLTYHVQAPSIPRYTKGDATQELGPCGVKTMSPNLTKTNLETENKKIAETCGSRYPPGIKSKTLEYDVEEIPYSENSECPNIIQVTDTSKVGHTLPEAKTLEYQPTTPNKSKNTSGLTKLHSTPLETQKLDMTTQPFDIHQTPSNDSFPQKTEDVPQKLEVSCEITQNNFSLKDKTPEIKPKNRECRDRY